MTYAEQVDERLLALVAQANLARVDVLQEEAEAGRLHLAYLDGRARGLLHAAEEQGAKVLGASGEHDLVHVELDAVDDEREVAVVGVVEQVADVLGQLLDVVDLGQVTRRMGERRRCRHRCRRHSRRIFVLVVIVPFSVVVVGGGGVSISFDNDHMKKKQTYRIASN